MSVEKFYWVNRLVLTRLIHFRSKFVSSMKIVGATGLGGFVGVKVGVANSRNKLALRTWLRSLESADVYNFWTRSISMRNR